MADMDVAFIDKYDMMPCGGKILCAVSGGADSVYLLHRALEMSRQRGIFVYAAHYNHCLRGAESDRDELFVRGLCEKLGVALVAGRGDAAAYAVEKRLGIEEAARTLRYAFLERAADELGADRILTAHTSNDNAETLLLNLARGTGLRGMGGIPPVRGRVARPMLMTARAEVERYLRENGLAWVEDSTNSEDVYTRNRVRHHIIPEMVLLNAGFIQNASRAAELMREDEAFLDALARDFCQRHVENGRLPADRLAALPRPVAARAVRLLAGARLGAEHVEAVLALAGGRGLGHADITGMRVTRDQGFLYFGREEISGIPPVLLEPGVRLYISEADVTLICEEVPGNEEINSSFKTFFFNMDGICGNISCTSFEAGDKIRIYGRNCTKKLSDLFAERKLTQAERKTTPVLKDEEGVIAVYGFGIAEHAAAKPGDRVLKIDIKPGENI